MVARTCCDDKCFLRFGYGEDSVKRVRWGYVDGSESLMWTVFIVARRGEYAHLFRS